MDIQREKVDTSKYIIVRYRLKSKINLWDAAYQVAVGQSIGNPNIRNSWETETMFEKYSCKIIGNKKQLQKIKQGEVPIAFPLANINLKEDGISQLLCFVMGGQLDIDSIESCQLVDMDLDHIRLLKPKFGISGLRKYTGVYNKPLLGGIIKPKTGIRPKILLDIVKQLVDGGVNFIKEDEILGNPTFCPLEKRIDAIQPYLENKKVVYCYCINSDYPYCIERAEKVVKAGGNGIHINIWNGLGIYKTLRDYPLVIHFQKSGDRIFTSPKHSHYISWKVICKLAALMGVDTIHAGMWGGYSSQPTDELQEVMNILTSRNVMPVLSCGMHPGIVNKVTELFGCDYLANVGGAIHGHPGGTCAGTKAMQQAIDGSFGKEYQIAIDKWGLL